METAEILSKAQDFKDKIAELKRHSNYYPDILIHGYQEAGVVTEIYASTLVRVHRDNKWYVVHCVDSVVPTSPNSESRLLLRLMNSVHNVQTLYQITGRFEDLDTLQISEAVRLAKL